MMHVMMDARAVQRDAMTRHNRGLLQTLLDAGHQVTALCAPQDTLPEGVRALPVPVGVDAYGRSDAFSLLGWPTLVEQHHPDVVLGAAGMLPLGRCAARRVLMIHDVAFEHLPETYGVLERTARRVRLASCVAAAEVVVVASRWLADELRLMHPHADLHVVAPLMALGRSRDTSTRVRLNGLGLLPGQYFCLPFTPQARDALPLIMEAFGGLPMELDPQLVLMASEAQWNAGAHVDYLDEEHQDAVLITDALDDVTRGDVLRHAAAVLHPCVHDGVLLEALEGQALGSHVITSQAPAAAELLGRGVTMVEHRNVDGWLEAMQKALEAPPRRSSARRPDPAAAWLSLLAGVTA